MNKTVSSFLIGLLLVVSTEAVAAPRGVYNEQDRTMLRKIYDRIEMMRLEIGNHEAEIRTFDAKLSNMEDAIEFLREQVDEMAGKQQEKMRGSLSKIVTHEKSINGFANDLEKLQTHANDSSEALGSYKEQMKRMEDVLKSQTKNVDKLKKAMASLLEAVGGTDGSLDSYRIYHVQPGDSLGVIAQKHNTTIRDIKDLNGLTKDTIIVGQKLKIPER